VRPRRREAFYVELWTYEMIFGGGARSATALRLATAFAEGCPQIFKI
jgi:hypothetical protein